MSRAGSIRRVLNVWGVDDRVLRRKILNRLVRRCRIMRTLRRRGITEGGSSFIVVKLQGRKKNLAKMGIRWVFIVRESLFFECLFVFFTWGNPFLRICGFKWYLGNFRDKLDNKNRVEKFLCPIISYSFFSKFFVYHITSLSIHVFNHLINLCCHYCKISISGIHFTNYEFTFYLYFLYIT